MRPVTVGQPPIPGNRESMDRWMIDALRKVEEASYDRDPSVAAGSFSKMSAVSMFVAGSMRS